MRPSTRRFAVVLGTALAVVCLEAGVASTHVTAHAPGATQGGYGEVTFNVPTESDTASTVALSVRIPQDTPIASVSVKPVPGWTATTKSTHLAQPVTTDDGDTLTDVVSQVTWTTANGQGIAPGQYQAFSISVGPLPKVPALSFPAIQTYSDGKQVAWIDPRVSGQPEPQHPAPRIQLSGSAGANAAAAVAGATAGSATGATAGSATGTGGGTGPGTVGIAALVIGVVALLTALSGLALGLSARRRPASPVG